MKKLHVLNIAFHNEVRVPTLEQIQQSSHQPVQLAFCTELLQLVPLKGKEQLKIFKENLSETRLIKLIHVLKRYRKLQMDNLMGKRDMTDFKKGKATKEVNNKSENYQNKYKAKEVLATIEYLKEEISQKNKKIVEQKNKIVRLTNKNKLPVDKPTREAFMEKLNFFGQNQLKKMMVDAKSFYQKRNTACETKRDSKSAMEHKKFLKRSKLFVKKSFAIQNKENHVGTEKIHLKFDKKEKSFEKINQISKETKQSQVTDQNMVLKKDKIQKQCQNTGPLFFEQITKG